MLDAMTRPSSPARLLFVPVAVAYLVLVARPGDAPSIIDWLVIAGSIVAALGGGRWPLPATVLQAALLIVAEYADPGTAVGLKIMASLALFELAARRSAALTSVGALAVAAAYATHAAQTFPDGALGWLYRIAAVVATPVLIGAVLKTAVRRAADAADRAADAERQRVLAEHAVRRAERAAIARELHDLVAHHVSSMLIRVGAARHAMPDRDPRLAAVLDDVYASASSALADLRALLVVLRDPTLAHQDPGPLLLAAGELPSAIGQAVATANATGLVVEARVDDEVRALDPVRRIAVLRMVQEGLANAARHAGPAARVALEVRLRGGTASVSIRDFGANAPAVAGPGGGQGLIGLRERIELAGGSLTAGPDGAGWLLAARLPPGGRAVASVT
ncbi:hypothetical protein Athai_14890 [Actinocatenispora thailandica]|uniref:histidine kinase n=2 Tax=Actinocatenispora thailandica TaxID=227318 RepID=A0A7R7DLW8_9ACTN|nr:hypothetical protein Athai_14890 [Actinocatenispora thailandica]